MDWDKKMKNNGQQQMNMENIISIAIYPADGGFACAVIEKEMPIMTHEYTVALTIAYGMVKMALEVPDIIFDEGVEAMTRPSENKSIKIVDIIKKRKLH